MASKAAQKGLNYEPVEKIPVVEPSGTAASFGHRFLRVSAGLMIFYIHGWHKLEGWIACLQHGTP